MLSFVGERLPLRAFERAIEGAIKAIGAEYGHIDVLGRPCYHPLPIVPRSRLSRARALVMGDAAGLVNPFSGEGLSAAILSAKIACDVLVESCRRNQRDLSRYDQLCRHEIIPHLRFSNLAGPYLHLALNLLGHEKLLANLKKDQELVDLFAAYIEGVTDSKALVLGTAPRLPRLILGHQAK
jgi:flavin-dependent dehydrogenase